MDPLRGETPVLLCCQRHRQHGQEALDPTHSLRRLDLQAPEEPSPRRETGCRRCYIRFPGGFAERALQVYSPKHSTIVHRFHFNTRSKQPSESITVYVAALRELALDCKYGSTELLEEMLRDRLVCGVSHPGIQRELLAEVDLTFKSTPKLAQTMEAARRYPRDTSTGSGLTYTQLRYFRPPGQCCRNFLLPLQRTSSGQPVQA